MSLFLKVFLMTMAITFLSSTRMGLPVNGTIQARNADHLLAARRSLWWRTPPSDRSPKKRYFINSQIAHAVCLVRITWLWFLRSDRSQRS